MSAINGLDVKQFFFFKKKNPILTIKVYKLKIKYWIVINSLLLAAKLLQSCPTLCDPIDDNPQGSPIPGILQARTLEWVAISFSNAWKWKVKGKSLSRVRLLTTPWTVAYQAPSSMRFSRQEYWSGVPYLDRNKHKSKTQSSLLPIQFSTFPLLFCCQRFVSFVCVIEMPQNCELSHIASKLWVQWHHTLVAWAQPWWEIYTKTTGQC